MHRGTATAGQLADDVLRTRRVAIRPSCWPTGDLGFNEVMSLPPRPGDPGDGADRVSRFADYLFGAMDDSTTSVDGCTDGVTGPTGLTAMTD